jgi:hypothetical protein
MLPFLALSLLAAGGPCVAPTPGPVTWWGGDANALDLVSTNHAAPFNGAAYAPGLVAQAFSLDGVDDYVQAPDGVGAFASDAFTVDFWMRAADPGNSAYLLGRSHPDSGQGFDLRLNAGALQVVGVNGWGFNIVTGAVIVTDTWQHVALASTASTVELYVGGMLAGTSARAAIPTSSNPFRIGYTTGYGGSPFAGRIDEVAISDRALGAAEIAAIVAAGSAGRCRSCAPAPPGLVSWWRGEDDARDAAGANHGTLVGGAGFAAGKVGRALTFDGLGGHMQTSHGFAYTADLSVAAWLRPQQTGSLAFVIGTEDGFGQSDGGWGLHWDNPAGNFSFGAGCGAGNWTWGATAAGFAAGEWHHVAGVFAGPVGRVYVDGALAVEFPRTCAILPGTALRLGLYPNRPARPYLGALDEAAVFSRALLADELAALYNASGAGQCVDRIFVDGFEAPPTLTAPGEGW